MTSLTFYGGVNEIGGNKILRQDKDTKIFLDFGKGFTGLEKYLCALGFFSFNALIDMKPKSGTVYIHLASEACNEEQVLSTKRLKNWIDKFQMVPHQIHCSGHANGEDMMSMVKEIDAKMPFPLHTEYPTEYVRVTNKITIVEHNRKYEMK